MGPRFDSQPCPQPFSFAALSSDSRIRVPMTVVRPQCRLSPRGFLLNDWSDLGVLPGSGSHAPPPRSGRARVSGEAAGPGSQAPGLSPDLALEQGRRQGATGDRQVSLLGTPPQEIQQLQGLAPGPPPHPRRRKIRSGSSLPTPGGDSANQLPALNLSLLIPKRTGYCDELSQRE